MLRRAKDLAMNANVTYKVHAAAAAIWLLLMIPTTTTWRQSILWVGLISCYANFVSHWGAYQAALAQLVAGRAEQAAKDAVEGVRRDAVKDTDMLKNIEKAVTECDKWPSDCICDSVRECALLKGEG